MRAVLLVLVLLTGSLAAATPVTVVLERGGHREQTDDGVVQIPRFGGPDRVWTAVLACVRDKFGPFAVEVVDRRPPSGDVITAVIGGSADQLGFDPEYDAVVHVFSRTIGERDTQQLCETTAHEIGHALGLDHSMQCGDLMSYPRDECGERPVLAFTNVDAACGEYRERDCAWGATQNSYQRLAALVGLRETAPTDDAPTDDAPTDDAPPPTTPAEQVPADEPTEEPAAEPVEQPVNQPTCRRHRHHRWRHVSVRWN
jgi:hypothetical protein